MKKLFSLMLVLVLVLSMAACADPKVPETSEPPVTETVPAETVLALDLETVYQNILTAVNAGDEIVMFPEGNPEVIDAFYVGLSDVELKQQVYYIHPITGFACEIMLVEVANEADVPAVEAILQSRIDLGCDDGFYPETAAMWQANSQVQISGNYVCMIALPEGCQIPEDVFGL